MFAFKSPYDQTAFDGLKNFEYLFPNYFTIQANKNFIRYVFTDYYFLIIFLGINTLFYLQQKKMYKLFITLGFFLGFTLLVNVCYHGGGNQFYYENQYLILSIFVIIPFLFDVAPVIVSQHKKLFYTMPLIISLVCFLRIGMTANYYSAMINWKLNAIEKMSSMKDKRVIINISQVPKTAILDTWSNAYEFWFLSTVDFGYSQSTIIEEVDGQHDWTWDYYDKLVTGMEITKYKDLKKPYFNYPSSTALDRYKP